MMKFGFEIGKEYQCGGLYGEGATTIRIVDRTPSTISYVYDERSSSDRSVQTAEIEVRSQVIYDKNLNKLDVVEQEVAVAWTYHSRYAGPNDFDYGYYGALGNDKLWTADEWDDYKTDHAAVIDRQ